VAFLLLLVQTVALTSEAADWRFGDNGGAGWMGFLGREPDQGQAIAPAAR